jgi:hypothetical protein
MRPPSAPAMPRSVVFAVRSTVTSGVPTWRSRSPACLYQPAELAHPYLAPNLNEFWRRWHMSLTGWFRTALHFRRR